MPIKTGHIIQFVVSKGREYNCPNVEGIVYKITYNDSLKCYSIFIRPVDKMGLTVIQTGKIEYGKNFKLIGVKNNFELKEIQKEMEPFDGPLSAKTIASKRSKMKIREDALLTPNTDYSCKFLEGYVRTKKMWYRIERTTAKMVSYFDGLQFRKCSINNITDTRKMK